MHTSELKWTLMTGFVVQGHIPRCDLLFWTLQSKPSEMFIDRWFRPRHCFQW